VTLSPPPEGESAASVWQPPGSARPDPPPPDPAQPAWGPQPGWGPPPGWGPHPGWGYAPPPPQPATNSWAVVALVTGILPLIPVALGAGITALVQVRRRDERGKGLAVAGLICAGVWTVLLTAFVVAGLNGAFGSESLGRVREVGSPSVGSCLVKPLARGGTWEASECSGRHDAEVYLARSFPWTPGTTWPGSDYLTRTADGLCLDNYAAYTGESYYTSDHDYGFFVPDEEEWVDGERRVVCAVTPGILDELVGSARRPG
jgi:hypothetical protein